MQAGELLAGKYRIQHVLGEGGMGKVCAAMHETLGQRVAIKFLLPQMARRPEVVARFLREARAVVRLKSEHVGRVIDVGTTEDGAPYLVMEYLEGHDLAHRGGRATLPAHEAVDYLLQASEAIAEAHALGIVHRDLKPANLFLTRQADGSPLVKVLDFGIAKAAATDDQDMTATQTVMGSPDYMPPEQFRSTRDVDARADIWSLGVVLYELLAGCPPFRGESFPDTCVKVVSAPTPPITVPGIPPGLEAAIGRCLQKDREARFANIAEMAAAIAPFGPPGANLRAAKIARVLSLSSPDLDTVLGSSPGAPSITTLAAAAGQAHQPTAQVSSGGGRKWWVLGGIAAAAAAAILVVALSSGDSGAQGEQAAGAGTAQPTETDEQPSKPVPAKPVPSADLAAPSDAVALPSGASYVQQTPGLGPAAARGQVVLARWRVRTPSGQEVARVDAPTELAMSATATKAAVLEALVGMQQGSQRRIWLSKAQAAAAGLPELPADSALIVDISVIALQAEQKAPPTAVAKPTLATSKKPKRTKKPRKRRPTKPASKKPKSDSSAAVGGGFLD